MFIYSSFCIVLQFLDLFFFLSLLNNFYYGLEGYKALWGKTAKENITPRKM